MDAGRDAGRREPRVRLSPKKCVALLLTLCASSVLASCEEETAVFEEALVFDIDVVVRNGQPKVFVCEVDTECRRENRFWWPKMQECEHTSDLYGEPLGPSCEPKLNFLLDGVGVNSDLVPGLTYELVVQGCGYEATRIPLTLPTVELVIEDIQYDAIAAEVAIRYSAPGADVAALSAGNWTSMQTCISDASGQVSHTGAPNPLDATLAVFATSERSERFGNLTFWIGVQEVLDLNPGMSD